MQDVVKWATENPAAAAAVFWPVLSGVINLLLKQHTVDEWVTLAEQRPRTAALIKFVRGAGLDPRKTLAALAAFVQGKADKLHTPSQPK
jgi:hypothetical protein